MYKTALLSAGLWSALFFASIQAAEIPEGVKLSDNQTFTRALRGDPESLDPHLATGIPDDMARVFRTIS